MTATDTQQDCQTKTHYLADYQPPAFEVVQIHCSFELLQGHTVCQCVMQVRRTEAGSTTLCVLDGDDLDLQSVSVDGQTLAVEQFQRTKTTLTIHGIADEATIETVVHLYPEKNTCLMGLYASRGNFCTQCEPHGFRRITYAFDRPDVMTVFTTTITADKQRYPMLLSNGNMQSREEHADGRHTVTWHDPSRKSSYLFALVAGDFELLEDQFVTQSGREVSLQFYIEKGYVKQSVFALEALKRSMQWDEEAYGREYDLDCYMVVAVSDFNFGAMENKGLNIFNTTNVLVDAATATDTDYNRVESVIGHEYFHNWSGNRVTLKNWFQITLKEGFTVFRDQSFSEEMLKSELVRLSEVGIIETQQFAEDASPLSHPIRPESYIQMNNFYTNTVYQKGAEVIRMLHTLMGADAFRQASDLYFERFDGCAVTTEDFLSTMCEVATQIDEKAFAQWYHRAGTPIVTITDDYDTSNQVYRLTVSQTMPNTEDQTPMYFPLAMGLLSPDAGVIATKLQGEPQSTTQTRVLVVSERCQTWTFEGVPVKPIPSLMRRFSAPVRWVYDYSDAELLCLWLHDTDAYARNAAKQSYCCRLLARIAEDCQAERSPEVPTEFLEAYDALINQDTNDLNVQAHLLALPNKSFLLQRLENHSIDSLKPAIDALTHAIAMHCQASWLTVLKRLPMNKYAFTVAAQAERSMRGVALYFLGRVDSTEQRQAIQRYYHAADNMTDSMAALNALNHAVSEEREAMMADFLQRWRSEPLVLRKWLGLQAGATHAVVNQSVQALLDSDVFDWHNPNIVYGLFFSYVRNWDGLHAADGSGYELLRDAVLRLDKTNPQVASRLARSLTQWQSVDVKRRGLMCDALDHICNVSGISNDLFEIASKGRA